MLLNFISGHISGWSCGNCIELGVSRIAAGSSLLPAESAPAHIQQSCLENPGQTIFESCPASAASREQTLK